MGPPVGQRTRARGGTRSYRSLITLEGAHLRADRRHRGRPDHVSPRGPGGVRNWDYRYCWLRDATLTLDALLDPATRRGLVWRKWLLPRLAGDPSSVQIMYGPAGERRLAEWELDWLPGYEGSAPVRIGNAAAEPVPARRLRRGHRRVDAGRHGRARCDQTPGRCSGPCWSSWRSTGTSPTRASGRSAAPGATSCTPR